MEHRLPRQEKYTAHHQLGPPKAAMGTELTKYSDGSAEGTRNSWSVMAGVKEPAAVFLSRGLSRDKQQQQHSTSFSSSKLCICGESLNLTSPELVVETQYQCPGQWRSPGMKKKDITSNGNAPKSSPP